MINSVKILYTNADQLSTKIVELKTRILTEKPKIVIITEVNNKHTRLPPDKILYSIPDFQMFDKNLSIGYRGILIYITDIYFRASNLLLLYLTGGNLAEKKIYKGNGVYIKIYQRLLHKVYIPKIAK